MHIYMRFGVNLNAQQHITHIRVNKMHDQIQTLMLIHRKH